MVKFKRDVYQNSVVKFAAGAVYPLTSETQFFVSRGDAERVAAPAVAEVPIEAPAEPKPKRRGR